MRLLLYKAITQLIILLGAARNKILPWDAAPWPEYWSIRNDRTFYANSFESWSCCDCGLIHLTRPLPDEEPKFPAFRFIPVRPKNYDYSWRAGAATPSEYHDESPD